MINIKKFDSVALAVKDVLQQEALKGDQHKIDKNKNNKIDAHDFKILRGEKPEVKKEEVEKVEEVNNPFDYKNYKSQLKTKPGEKAGFDSKKISTGTVYTRKPVKDEPMKKEEVEQVDERTLTKGETAEKERIVKGMKKNLAGFKARYGERAKSVMYATATKSAKNEEVVTEAKRPESDTVPFITNGDSKPLQHAKDLAKKSLKRLKSEMMGKTGTSE